LLPDAFAETYGPVFGHETIRATDSDLTKQHAGEPLGERIIVSGKVLDDDGHPVRGALMEIWQANAAGRYKHKNDNHAAPLDPIFNSIPDENARNRLVSTFDWPTTKPERALGYRFDIVVRGGKTTPMDMNQPWN